MTAAAGSYVEWLSATAAQAEQTAAQARAAAAAYEAAFALTVPPPVIAANRSLLAALVATNFLGQNTPAIAATEAQYAEMWAQDAVAMYGYAGSSASATALTPVHLTAAEHRTRRDGRPSRRCQPSDGHLRRQCAKHRVECPAGVLRGAQRAAEPGDRSAGGLLHVDPAEHVGDLINIFFNA